MNLMLMAGSCAVLLNLHPAEILYGNRRIENCTCLSSLEERVSEMSKVFNSYLDLYVWFEDVVRSS
jgi:hypothetical protein